MATLNVGIKISGGTTFTTSSTGTSATVFTTGPDEYAEVEIYNLSSASSGNCFLRVGSLNYSSVFNNGNSPLITFPNIVKLIVPPNSSLNWTRSSGTTATTTVSGSYVLRKNTI